MALDQTSALPILKQYYTKKKVEEIVYSSNPFLAAVQKNTNWSGEQMKIPLIYANPQNRSNTFATAAAGTSTSALKAFFHSRVSDYSFASIAHETMKATAGNSEAFISALTLEMDGAMHSLSRSLAVKLFRSGSGSIAQVGSVVGNVITLSDPDQVTSFEVGQVLKVSVADGGGAYRTGTMTVVAIDRTAGTVTAGTIVAGTAAADYIFNNGDEDKGFNGLDAWIPLDNRAARLAATFNGVVRSADATRLGGLVRDYSTGPYQMAIEEALQDAALLVAREGGSPKVCYVNFQDWSNLARSLGTRVQYSDFKTGETGAVGFRSLVIQGPKGVIEVIADQNCPAGRFFMLSPETWELCSLGDSVSWFDADGNKLLRSGTEDSLTFRCYSYSNLACHAPGYNLQGKLR